MSVARGGLKNVGGGLGQVPIWEDMGRALNVSLDNFVVRTTPYLDSKQGTN